MEVGCPGTQGLELPTQTQVARTSQKPALPATQPRGPPALLKASGLTQPGEKGAHGPKATAPKGPDLRHPTQVREMGRKRHTCFANRLETSLKEPAERI